MKTYIGVDLGTSGVKLLLVDKSGKILSQACEEYPTSCPRVLWSEQNPADWWESTVRALHTLLTGQDAHSVNGISFSGQMHGLVALDKDDNVIRPCILWNDGRTEQETKYLNEIIGKEKLSDLTGNISFAGFTAPKLLWLKNNEPNNFRRIAKIMLPKDYLAYKLTGEFCTDYSDASGTLLLDVKNKCWSDEMLRICGVTELQLPTLYESFEVVGTIKKEFAELLGLSENVKIIAGAGDNAAAAIGTGTVASGSCNISLGTSGTIFLPQDSFSVDEKNALHSFCHANGKWHLMGCILSAASARQWWLRNILGSDDYESDEKAVVNADTDGLYFLPYLSGERSPHNDVNAKGAFIGLTAATTQAQMSRAVMEGVAFALRDCLGIAKGNGLRFDWTTICGGGAKSAVWVQSIADVLGLPVRLTESEQGPAYGAAILAMVGCGEYANVQCACEKLIKYHTEICPNPNRAEIYERKFHKYRLLYPALKNILWAGEEAR